MSQLEGTLTVYADAAALADGVAAWLTDLATAKGDIFTVCLSGGSTPKRLYERLAQSPYREQFPWAKTHFFFGDERFVPADNKDNNFRMARDALLAHVPVPDANVHPVNTARPTAEDAAVDYERTLRDFYGSGHLDPDRPLFDVMFLGLGPDGHTASLIPGEPILEERQKWVGSVAHGRPEARITLTYPVLESSANIAFLITGSEKTPMMRAARAGDTAIPAGRLQTMGHVVWFADEAAAGGQ
ncbi:6-phosphogluconolactonase [Lichenihabitans sp. Uapishka_5]|uniref:6-phosphogluconolactonase n=1 Tax=Lichenihabitans sp. Uapishka_5 TaxID=3037302 RepID=UPI0029E7ED39|nr:6-phosphogluconolactonase [Lichenihabitans sp. Uapishka_5]MDX7951881.1 6-phosphogluconolactonase [Lichenihabitans sp. Uapishka_5]